MSNQQYPLQQVNLFAFCEANSNFDEVNEHGPQRASVDVALRALTFVLQCLEEIMAVL